MGLSDFEKELAASKAKEPRKKRERSRSRDREHRHHRSKGKEREDRDRHHHSSRRDDKDDRRSHKRSRHHRETSEERHSRWRKRRERGPEDEQVDGSKSRRNRSVSSDDQERIGRKNKSRRGGFEDSSSDDDDDAMDKDMVPPEDDLLDTRLNEVTQGEMKRDAWMEAPSSMDVDYVNRRKKEDKSTYISATKASDQPQIQMSGAELNHQYYDKDDGGQVQDEPAQREVDYTFGDSGAQWRMTKLKAVYRTAEESGRSVEDVALERYGDLRDFDEAREEEVELDRRETYGRQYVGKVKPSGEFFEERKLKAGIHRTPSQPDELDLPQAQIVDNPRPSTTTTTLDATALNKLKAQMLKAKMKGAGNAAELEAEYNAALAQSANRKEPDVVVLGVMDNRMLAGGRKGEVTHLHNKRGLERGLVVANDDMSIDDMVRQERRTRGQPGGEGLILAEKIAKDSAFTNDLDYIDENAAKLAQRAPKSDVNLRNAAIEDFQKMNRILDSCPLCHHEDKSPPQPPIAPIVSLATRVFLTLPTEPEISEGGAVIVPIQHHTNLLECDDDEWDEIRNFMKCLTRLYHDQGRDVLFYENAVAPHRKPHAAMCAVPIPFELGETAPAFFREAILEADEEWTQHKKIIDTLKASRNGQGKLAFRKSIAKEAPYFHVWFELDGGMGHVVEDARRWPKGDLFAREVIGGMLDVGVEVIKRQGRWNRADKRVDGFKKRWRKFDWTRVLTDG